MKKSTTIHGLSLIERALHSIHMRPEGPHTAGSLAHSVNLSRVHFHRVFAELMGESVGSYVRRVRLERAVALMRARPDILLSEVAGLLGYSELSAFSRAFKARYGVPASSWDRRKPLSGRTKVDAHCQTTGEDLERYFMLLDQRGAAGPEVSIETFVASRWATLRVPYAHKKENLAMAFDTLENWLGDRGQLRADRCFVGFSYGDPFSSSPDELAFDLGYPIDELIGPSGSIFIRKTRAFRAGVVHCTGGLLDFVSAWRWLQIDWLASSEYEPGTGPRMEIYYEDPRPSGLLEWDMDCVLPIEPA